MDLRRVAAVGVLVLGVLVLVASGDTKDSKGSASSSSGSHPPEADVAVASCALSDNQFEGPQANLTVTNHSSKASNYIIEVVFETTDGGTQLDTGNATITNLAPNQTANEKAVSFKGDLRKTAAEFKCKVANVTRLAAG